MKRHYRASFFDVLDGYSLERLLELLVMGKNPRKLESWLRATPEAPTANSRAFFITAVTLKRKE